MNPDEHHVALPKLYGAPAYARPPRVFEENERPPDPDDLPLEAFRDDEGLPSAASTFEPPAAEPPGFEADMEPPMSSSSGYAASDATPDAATLDPSMPGDAVAGDVVAGDAEPADAPPAAGQGPWAETADGDDGEEDPDASDIASAGEPLEPIEPAAEADVPPGTETAAPAAPFSLRSLGRLIQRR